MKWFFTIIYFVLSLQFHAQGGFKRQFKLPGVLNHTSLGIYEKSDGSFLAGGIIYDTVQGYSSFRLVIMGLDAHGQPQWTKKYGDHKFQFFGKFPAPWFYFDGNFMYHAGSVKDSLNKIYGVLMKFDLNGDTVWQKTYKDTLYNVAPEMVTKSDDGGLFLTGTWLNPTGDDPALLIKTDSNGNELWRKEIHKNGKNYQECKALLQDSASKKIVIVGMQTIGDSLNWWFYSNILILDSLGNKLAQHNFGGPDGGSLSDLIQTKDGKFVAVGYRIFPQMIGGTNLRKAFAVKFDVNTPNPPIWRFSFDKLVLNNVFSDITELDNGDMIVGGSIDTMVLHNMQSNSLIRLTRIGNNGVVKWNKYYNYKTNSSGSSNGAGLWSLNTMADKGFIASIEVANTSIPNPFFFVKFDSTGCDSTLDYCQMMAEVNVNELQLQDVSFRIYPNPFKDEIKIDIHSISASFKDPLVFTITDITGKVLQTSQFNSLQKTIILETKNLSSGLYFLNSLFDGKSYTFKVYKE
jgi:hypothetical protein